MLVTILLQERKSGLAYRTLLVFSSRIYARRLTEEFAVKKNTRDTGSKEYLGVRGNGVVLDLLQVLRRQFKLERKKKKEEKTLRLSTRHLGAQSSFRAVFN